MKVLKILYADDLLRNLLPSKIYLCYSSHLKAFIYNTQNDQLPVGLIAQLVEHCTGITDAMGLNPVQA